MTKTTTKKPPKSALDRTLANYHGRRRACERTIETLQEQIKRAQQRLASYDQVITALGNAIKATA